MQRTEALTEFDQRGFERFSGQGYLRLGSLLSPDELTELRRAFAYGYVDAAAEVDSTGKPLPLIFGRGD